VGGDAVSVPAWLLWLLPVPVATLAAVAWAAWSSRTRGPQDTADGVAAYERFRAALAQPPGKDPERD
jgi:cytochrome c-type biogenesis protein CcmH/NrfF